MGRERSSLEAVVKTIEDLDAGVSDNRELLAMAVEEDDADTVADVEAEIASLEAQLAKLEFRRMFSGEMDQNNAFPGYSVGLWWHRGSGLGGDAFAYVFALG